MFSSCRLCRCVALMRDFHRVIAVHQVHDKRINRFNLMIIITEIIVTNCVLNLAANGLKTALALSKLIASSNQEVA